MWKLFSIRKIHCLTNLSCVSINIIMKLFKKVPLAIMLLSFGLALSIPNSFWTIFQQTNNLYFAWNTLSNTGNLFLALILLTFNILSLFIRIYLVWGLLKFKKLAFYLFYVYLLMFFSVGSVTIYAIMHGSSHSFYREFITLLIQIAFAERIYHYRSKFTN